MGLVSAWLPFLDSRIMARWFDGGHFWWLAPVPLLALANAFALWRAAMREGRDAAPFLLTLTFFVLGFTGLVLGIWPNIVPPSWHTSHCSAMRSFGSACAIFATSPAKCSVSAGRSLGRSDGTMLL